MSLASLFANARAKASLRGKEQSQGEASERANADAGEAPRRASGAPATMLRPSRARLPTKDIEREERMRKTRASSESEDVEREEMTIGEASKRSRSLGSDGEERRGRARATTSERARKREKTTRQMCLDLGQKSLTHCACVRCGLVYAKGDPSDERTHARYHDAFVRDGAHGQMTYKIKADAKCVWMSDDGDVRCVRAEDASAATQKVARGVERELSLPEDWVFGDASNGVKAFVCVEKRGNKVVGALFAEKVRWGYRTIPVSASKDSTEGSTVKHGGVEEKATCGVRAIWTHARARKKGYARAMLNAMRAHMVPGYVVPVKECAFTQPTEAGTALALRYSDSDTFLVY